MAIAIRRHCQRDSTFACHPLMRLISYALVSMQAHRRLGMVFLRPTSQLTVVCLAVLVSQSGGERTQYDLLPHFR